MCNLLVEENLLIVRLLQNSWQESKLINFFNALMMFHEQLRIELKNFSLTCCVLFCFDIPLQTDTFTSVYKKLTGKDVHFEFPEWTL